MRLIPVLAVALLLACSSRTTTSRSSLEGLDELAWRMAAEQEGGTLEEVRLIQGAPFASRTREVRVYAYKYCVLPCAETRVVHFTEKGMLAPTIRADELEFARQNLLKLSPSLREELEVQGRARAVATFRVRSSIDYGAFEADAVLSDERILEFRKTAMQSARAEIDEATARVRALGFELVVDRWNSMVVVGSKAQFESLAGVADLLEATLVTEPDPVVAVPFISEVLEENGTRAWQNSYNAHGAGVGVLVHESGGPPFGSQFPANDMASFVSESIPSAIDDFHSYRVYSVLASSRASELGAASAANFGFLSGDRLSESLDAFESVNSLLVGQSSVGRHYHTYNGSLGFKRSQSDADTELGSFTRMVDAISWSSGFTFVFANGNLNSPGVERSEVSASPANGFNVVAVGGARMAGRYPDQSDDELWLDGATLNPPSVHGDRQKPELVAPSTVLMPNPLSPTPFNNLSSSTGSSFAAPQVAGAVSLFMESVWQSKGRPDLIRAVLAASSVPLVNGRPQGSGAGQLNAERLGEIANAPSRPFIVRTLRCSDLSRGVSLAILLPQSDQTLRVATAWQTQNAAGAPFNTPDTDVDLIVRETRSGLTTEVGRSASFDSTVETLSVQVVAGASYEVVVESPRCGAVNMLPLSLVWARE